MDNPLAHQSASHNNATNNSQVNSESSSAKTSAGTEANQHATSEQQQQTGAQVENTDDASAGDGKDKPNVKKSRCYSCLSKSSGYKAIEHMYGWWNFTGIRIFRLFGSYLVRIASTPRQYRHCISSSLVRS